MWGLSAGYRENDFRSSPPFETNGGYNLYTKGFCISMVK